MASPADLLASRVGAAEKRTAQLLAAARHCAPSAVLLEEMENLVPKMEKDNLEGGRDVGKMFVTVLGTC